MIIRIVAVFILGLPLAGCLTAPPDEFDEKSDECALLPRLNLDSVAVEAPGPSEKNASIYAAHTTVDFRIELTAYAWDTLMKYKEQRRKSVVPAIFEFDGERVMTAALRLKGNSERWGPDKKNQFVIRFDYFNGEAKGRFRGLRRLNLDHEGLSPLRNQLGMRVMSEAGIPAPRVNHARLHITVTDSDDPAYPHGYYGLYENIEVIDREFLEDRFADPTGNLYKHGNELKTNKDIGNVCDLDLLYQLVEDTDVDGDHSAFWARLPQLTDIDWLLTYMAAEAVMALGDNHWAGGNNFYYYNDPQRGMVLLPWDVDDILSPVSPPQADIYDFSGVVRLGALPNRLWAVARENPAWRDQFAAEVARITNLSFRGLGPVIGAECARIREDVMGDPNRRFTMDDFDWDCDHMQQRVSDRTDYLDGVLAN